MHAGRKIPERIVSNIAEICDNIVPGFTLFLLITKIIAYIAYIAMSIPSICLFVGLCHNMNVFPKHLIWKVI